MTLSLAGIFQSAYLVQKLAYTGKCDSNIFKVCLESILEIKPNSLIEIYGKNERNLNIGLKLLVSILTFSHYSSSHFELIKYVFNMIIIENKLKNNHKKLYEIKEKLLNVSNQYDISKDINFLTNRLAEVYLSKISSLGSRILVKGEKSFLDHTEIQEKIRCLLFSGIRSVSLWKQFGGNKLQIILFRNVIIKKAQKILINEKNTV